MAHKIIDPIFTAQPWHGIQRPYAKVMKSQDIRWQKWGVYIVNCDCPSRWFGTEVEAREHANKINFNSL